MIRALSVTMNILQAITIAAMCIVPQPPAVLCDSVDLAHINHFYDEHGRLVFDQIIFVEIVSDEERIRAWRLIKSPSQLPVRDWQNGGFVCRWLDGDESRAVRIKSVREDWTQHDPELLARETLAKESRRELTHHHPLRLVGGGLGRE